MATSPELMSSTIEIGGKEFSRQSNEKFLYTIDEYERYRDATVEDRNREFENLNFAAGLNNGQWNQDAVDDLEDEGRHVGTYNLSYRKISGIAGSIVKNPFDVKYVGDDPNLDNITFALQQAYLSDKELMDWESEYLQCVLYGLLYQGVLRMSIENTPPASRLGNIALRCELPGSIITDPDWKSVSSKKLTSLYREVYLTADKIKQIFSAKSEEITRELKFLEIFGKTFEDNERVDWNRNNEYSRGSQFLVVEKHYLEEKEVAFEIDPITETVFTKEMDDDEKVALAMANDIPPERIRKRKEPKKVYRRIAVAPGLSSNLILADQEDVIQIGRLPFFFWSATKLNGKRIGLVDFLKDAQREINYRQTTITTGAQGAVMTGVQVDPAAFGNDDIKMEDFQNNYGNSRQVAWLKPGASRQFPNAIRDLPRLNIAPQLFEIVREMVDLMDLLVPQPAAGEARTERSGESGIHFQQKLEVMKTMQQPMMMGIRQLWNDIGESYLYLASDLYREGRRAFTNSDGEELVTINEPFINALGEEEVDNDFSQINMIRHRIQISESPSGLNVRLAQQDLALNYINIAGEQLPNLRLSFTKNLVDTLQMKEKDRVEAEEAYQKDKRLVESQTQAQIASNEATIKMAGGQPQGQPQQQATPGGLPPGAAPELPPPVQTPEPGIANPPTGAV